MTITSKEVAEMLGKRHDKKFVTEEALEKYKAGRAS